jgi:hypothetical protein
LLAYLKALYTRAPEDAFIELRFRTTTSMQQRFYPAAAWDRISRGILTWSWHTDVYIGVLARTRCGGRRTDVVPEGQVVWIDCDNDASVHALSRFVPPPSVVVRSGTGANRHAYWSLSESLSLDDIEDINRRLAAAIGGDTSSTDASWILRPPLSLNHKHEPPTRVSLERCHAELCVSVDDLLVDVPTLSVVTGPARQLRTGGDDSLLEIAPPVYIEALIGIRVPSHHKIACPFHPDRTPSLHVYDEPERGWMCYGCRRGGTIYDFAAQLWGLPTRGRDFADLRTRLLCTFSLIPGAQPRPAC